MNLIVFPTSPPLTGSTIVAAACPFCNTMLTDGVKNKEREGDVKVMDIAELIANAQDL